METWYKFDDGVRQAEPTSSRGRYEPIAIPDFLIGFSEEGKMVQGPFK